MGNETSKAFDRRMKEGWFLKHAQNLGIDIGSGSEGAITDECERWDLVLGNSDATFMEGIPDDYFDYAYSSHCLEHLADPFTALRNWYRIIKPGGQLIVMVPHRDLYEKKTLLPSRFNGDHKHFYLPVFNDPPHTLGLLQVAWEALGSSAFQLYSLRTLDDGHNKELGTLEHSVGEYSIEMILRKPKRDLWQ
jgi:SAM-dependent methyltransferase